MRHCERIFEEFLKLVPTKGKAWLKGIFIPGISYSYVFISLPLAAKKEAHRKPRKVTAKRFMHRRYFP